MTTEDEDLLRDRLAQAYPLLPDDPAAGARWMARRDSQPIRKRTAVAVLGAAAAVAVLLVVLVSRTHPAPALSDPPPALGSSVGAQASTSARPASSPAASTPPDWSAMIDHTWWVPGTRSTLYLHGNLLTWTDGCNGGHDQVRVTGDVVRIVLGNSSGGGPCPMTVDPLVDAQTLTWQIVGGRLVVTGDGGRSITLIDTGRGKVPFDRLPIANSAAAIQRLGTSGWRLPGTDLTVQFAAGQLNGSVGDCTAFRGAVVIAAATIQVPHADAQADCPHSSVPFFFNRQPWYWHLDDDLLILVDANDNGTQWTLVPPGG